MKWLCKIEMTQCVRKVADYCTMYMYIARHQCAKHQCMREKRNSRREIKEEENTLLLTKHNVLCECALNSLTAFFFSFDV